MRRLPFVCRGILFVFVSFGAIASDARAQASLLGRCEGAFGGGVSIPLGDFDDVAEMGYTITPRFGYYVHPRMSVGVEYAYYNNGASDDLIAFLEQLLGVNVDADFSIHQFTGYGKVLLTTNPVTPYLRAQLGMYRFGANVDSGLGSGSDSVSEFGIGGGGGVQFRGQGSVGGFVDAIFHVIFTDESSTELLGVQGGILFFFGTGS
jgi:hypothetical protein